ncbi:MAG: hypothetical protein R3C03_18220 [Pirellulaceae bacterium]
MAIKANLQRSQLALPQMPDANDFRLITGAGFEHKSIVGSTENLTWTELTNSYFFSLRKGGTSNEVHGLEDRRVSNHGFREPDHLAFV